MKSSFCFANVESVTVPATSFIDDLGPLRSAQAILGADHLSLEGGGGGDLEKKFLQALVGRKKLHAAQMK